MAKIYVWPRRHRAEGGRRPAEGAATAGGDQGFAEGGCDLTKGGSRPTGVTATARGRRDLAVGLRPHRRWGHGLAGRGAAMVVAVHSRTQDGVVKGSGKEVPDVEDEGNLDIFPTFSLSKTEK